MGEKPKERRRCDIVPIHLATESTVAELEALVRERWADFAAEYGYE